MLRIESLSLRRGPELLLEEADALITAGRRVAIIGANGAGKTSLFKLLLGELVPDAGQFNLPNNTRMSHMAQEVNASERSALEYVMDGHQQFRRAEQLLQSAEAANDDSRIASIHAELDMMQAYMVPVTASKLLHGLGFTQNQLASPVSAFSGGWRIRLNLAQALMSPSDLLLLDEPTNHLDLDAMLWLENWLKQYQGTLLFISHDRDFIDAVASNIMHFEHRKLNQYTGSYSDFERQRAEKLALQQAQFNKQQQRISEIQSFVTRFKAKATKAKQAQSRIKELERMELIAPAHVDSPFHFSFPEAEKSSSPLLNLQNGHLGYGDKEVITSFFCSLLPGQRIALLGPNGAGKSTLIKTLVGDQALLQGERTTGEHLHIGYFAQHQLEALDVGASPALHLQRLSPKASDQEIRTFLGGFGFKGDDALATVGKFSGGEKARLALAIIAWQKPNLLLLDEPTNHLDLEMRHALTMALQAFSGAILVVSHDRHLLKNTVDEFWLVANGAAELFKGDLHDYEVWLQDFQKQGEQRNRDTSKDDANQADEAPAKSAEERKARRRLEAENRKKLSPLKKRRVKIDDEMQGLQVALSALEGRLAESSIYDEANKETLKETLAEQADKQVALEEKEMAWFEVSEEIEQIEQLF